MSRLSNVLSKLAVIAVTGIAGVVGYLYANDNLVKMKIDKAVVTSAEAAAEVGNSIRNLKDRIIGGNEDPTKKNQEWVEEQWDALGI